MIHNIMDQVYFIIYLFNSSAIFSISSFEFYKIKRKTDTILVLKCSETNLNYISGAECEIPTLKIFILNYFHCFVPHLIEFAIIFNQSQIEILILDKQILCTLPLPFKCILNNFNTFFYTHNKFTKSLHIY